jgi:hypothetical protein
VVPVAIRVLLVNLPRMLSEIAEDVVNSQAAMVAPRC